MDLVVKDASLLIDLDDRRSSVVNDNTALRIVVPLALLLKGAIARIFDRHRVLVANRDMRVDDSIGGRDGNHARRVVNLIVLGQLEATCPCLVVSILHSVVLLIAIEDALAHRRRINLADSSNRLVVTLGLSLERLHGPNRIAIPVSLAVDVAVGLRIHRCVDKGTNGNG